MAKKFGKLLLVGTIVGACAGAYYYLKKKDEELFVDADEDFDDFDDFQDEDLERSYTPLNKPMKEEIPPTEKDDFDADDVDETEDDVESVATISEYDENKKETPVSETAKATDGDTVEEFFDEEEEEKIDDDTPIEED